ncbi:hypothetical protein HWV62_24810 [Athelia sp. TMB]|nr:hypothetical protein HWV62_24810 [Athelia sp. TMB]
MSDHPSVHILEMPGGWEYEQDVPTTDDPITGEIITFSLANAPAPEPEKTKRPPNRFILFRGEFKEQYLRCLPQGSRKTTAADMSRMAGEAWRVLPPEQKRYWKERAERCKIEHARAHPNYQYKPLRRPKAARRTKSHPGPLTLAQSAVAHSPEPDRVLLPPTPSRSPDREGRRRGARVARRSASYTAPASRELSPIAPSHSSEPAHGGDLVLPVDASPSSVWNEPSSWAVQLGSYSESSPRTAVPWMHGFDAGIPHLDLDPSRAWAHSSPDAFTRQEAPIPSSLESAQCFWSGLQLENPPVRHRSGEPFGMDPSAVFIPDSLHDNQFGFDAHFTNGLSDYRFGSDLEESQSSSYCAEENHSHAFAAAGANDMQYHFGLPDLDYPADNYPSPPSSECTSNWSRRYSTDSWVSE